MSATKVIRWRSPAKPPRRFGPAWVKCQSGEVYQVQASPEGWIGNVPGWEKVTGWRASAP